MLSVDNLYLAPLVNHIVLRSRECILEGSELHWTDRVLYDGQVCLTLDNQDAWTAHTPQAMAIKELWDQAVQHTKTERIQLQEGCTNLMRELRLSDEQSGIKPFMGLKIKPTIINSLSFSTLVTTERMNHDIVTIIFLWDRICSCWL